jgi:hypothetical protein
MSVCPDCGQDFPEPILLRHREFEHPLETEGSAAKEATVQETERRYTDDGFLRRTGAKPEAPLTDPPTLLGGLFESDSGAAIPPWERERPSGSS